MSSRIVLSAALFGGLALAALSGPAMAANATRPYQNIDRSNDAGNNTGDSEVDRLNRAQLDENYWPSRRAGQPQPNTPVPPTQPYYQR